MYVHDGTYKTVREAACTCHICGYLRFTLHDCMMCQHDNYLPDTFVPVVCVRPFNGLISFPLFEQMMKKKKLQVHQLF